MKSRALILAGVVLLGGAAYLLTTRHESPTQARALAKPAAQTPAPAQNRSDSAEARARDEAIHEKETQAQIAALARVQTERHEREEMETHAREIRANLEGAKLAAWTAILQTNWPSFEALRRQAAESPSRTAHCTLCNGRGSFDFCVVCGQSGKCVSCNGSGRTFGTQPCPACRGSGKCYFCWGTGKMACPFCDDGTIELNAPLPSAMMRLPAGPVAPPRPLLRMDQDVEQPQPPAVAATASSAKPLDQAHISGELPVSSEPPPPGMTWNGVGLSVAFLLAGFMTVRKLGPGLAEFLNTRLNPLAAQQAAAARDEQNPLAEETSLAEFFHALRASLQGAQDYVPAEAPGPSLRAGATEAEAGERRDPLQDFLDSAPDRLVGLRELLATVSRAMDDAERLKALGDFFDQIAPLKEASRLPALLPIWQVAAAMEGLLKQLTAKASNFTPSTLRTLAGAVELIERLCVPGLKPDLATNPPIRLLAVDDDLISRQAVSLSLKKALAQPELANNGTAGLELAARRPYDVIFLDVEMPGMDGFELCSKIRETGPNRDTPVVFVTSHSDFDSRARSTLTGAEDLIGKPFLSFEVTLKALTLLLRGRLGEKTSKHQAPSTREKESSKQQENSKLQHPSSSEIPSSKLHVDRLKVTLPCPAPSRSSTATEEASRNGTDSTPAIAPTPREFAQAVLKSAPEHLAELLNQLNAVRVAQRNQDVGELLGELYIGVHGLNEEAERAELRAVHKLGYSLEGLLKKLLEKPRLCTPSTLHATAGALELLQQLCREKFETNLSQPPIRLLVVDDDPLARRAVCGALQLAFGRPESVESGDAAVALAQRRTLDLVFMDVLMPGMDGFTACARIHETDLNNRTPVVFVTSQGDMDSRAQAMAAGGCGLIPKPVLSSEIVLTALTHILRARLEAAKRPKPPEKVDTETECKGSPAILAVALG